MSAHGPLGATGTAGALELSAAGDQTTAISRRGALALAGLVLGTLVIAVAAASTDSLLPQSTRPAPAWLAGPFAGSGLGLSAGALILVLLLVLGCYVLVVGVAERIPARVVVAAIVAVHALVLLGPPLLSTDVFSYQAYARMWAGYGINPYLHGPRAIGLDPLYPFIGAKWVAIPSAYGPVFTLLSAAVGTASIAFSALAFKGIAAAASLGTVALLWRAAPLRGLDPVRAVALFGLNPLVVVYGVGGGHNDLLMLLAVSVSLYAVLAGRERRGGALLALAAGLKLSAGLLFPFLLADRAGSRSPRRRRELLYGAGAAGLVIATATAIAFGAAPLALPAILAKAQAAGDWHSVPGLISTRLGLSQLGHVIGIVLGVGFAAVAGRLLVSVWRGRLDWIDAGAWAVMAMLLSASSLLPWYAAWLLPLAALGTDRRLERAALILTAVVLLIQLPDYVPHGTMLLGL